MTLEECRCAVRKTVVQSSKGAFHGGVDGCGAYILISPMKEVGGGEEGVELAPEGTLLAEFQKERTDAISEMFDNKYKDGIYPTSKFFARLDECVRALLAKREGEVRREVVDYIHTALMANDWHTIDWMKLLEAASKGGEISKGSSRAQ